MQFVYRPLDEFFFLHAHSIRAPVFVLAREVEWFHIIALRILDDLDIGRLGSHPRLLFLQPSNLVRSVE